MHRTRVIGGVIIIAIGLIWVGQGSGLLRSRSFMTGDAVWIAVGLLAAAIGTGLLVVELRRSR
jgi:hypothetical protein